MKERSSTPVIGSGRNRTNSEAPPARDTVPPVSQARDGDFARAPLSSSIPPPPSMRSPDEIARVEQFLLRLVGARFFGNVVLSLQNGHVVNVKTEQNMKLGDL